MVHIDVITRDVIGLAMRIHSELGPGLFESVYEAVLCGKLTEMGYKVQPQKPVEIVFEGKRYANALKIDLLVNDQLIIEIKSVEHNSTLHKKQLLTYLRLTNLSVGLVLNFGRTSLKEGIQRVVNDHIDSAPSAPSA